MCYAFLSVNILMESFPFQHFEQLLQATLEQLLTGLFPSYFIIIFFLYFLSIINRYMIKTLMIIINIYRVPVLLSLPLSLIFPFHHRNVRDKNYILSLNFKSLLWFWSEANDVPVSSLIWVASSTFKQL